jgi:hypothetical protein
MLLLAILATTDVDEAMRAATRLTPGEGRISLDAWIAANPASPDVPLARFWQAQSFVRESRFSDADRVLEGLSDIPGDLKWDARVLRADLLLAQHRWSAAEHAYAAIAAPAGSRWEYEARTRTELARSGGHRQLAVWITLAALLGVAGWRAASLRRALWPPPEELLFAAPLLVVALIAAAPRPSDERLAILSVALSAAPLLWINGAYLRARALKPMRRAGEALLGVAQASGVLFCAVVLSGLWDSVVNTWMAGVE